MAVWVNVRLSHDCGIHAVFKYPLEHNCVWCRSSLNRIGELLSLVYSKCVNLGSATIAVHTVSCIVQMLNDRIMCT